MFLLRRPHWIFPLFIFLSNQHGEMSHPKQLQSDVKAAKSIEDGTHHRRNESNVSPMNVIGERVLHDTNDPPSHDWRACVACFPHPRLVHFHFTHVYWNRSVARSFKEKHGRFNVRVHVWHCDLKLINTDVEIDQTSVCWTKWNGFAVKNVGWWEHVGWLFLAWLMFLFPHVYTHSVQRLWKCTAVVIVKLGGFYPSVNGVQDILLSKCFRVGAWNILRMLLFLTNINKGVSSRNYIFMERI